MIMSRLTIAMGELHEHKTIEEESSTALYEDDMTMALMLSLRDDVEAQAIHACDILQSIPESLEEAFEDNPFGLKDEAKRWLEEDMKPW